MSLVDVVGFSFMKVRILSVFAFRFCLACLEVESKYNEDMNVFYQKYMDLVSMHSSLIVPNKEKVKQYLKEIKLV